MEKDVRTVEDLLGAIEKAPTFGMNARELILQASRRIAVQASSVDLCVPLQCWTASLHSQAIPPPEALGFSQAVTYNLCWKAV